MTSPTYLGADVDGLDHLSQEFTQAAQVVDEVKAACEVIVAAASMFGPFGAAFVAYLKGTVIPWLTTISQALQAMAKVLSLHSQAQQDASSNATSLPSYTSPTTAPATSTQSYPLIGAVAGALLAAGALAFGGLGASTALPALIGAVSGTGGTAGEGGKAGEKPEDAERVAPHSAEVGKTFGTVMNRDALSDFESEELGLPKGSLIHATGSLGQVDGDIAAFKDKGEYVDTELLQLKGGAAAYAGIDPNTGAQLGVAGTASANIADVKVHTDVPLGGSSTLKLSDETTLGATAQGQAVVAYNSVTHTASANIGGDAFIGARTTATVQEVTPYFTNTTELTGQAGAGAAADAGVVLGDGHLSIHAGLGAAVGLGGSVKDNIDINYQRIATDAYTGATAVYNEAGTELDAAGRAISTYLTPVPPR